MYMGSGLALITIGATLRYAVDTDWDSLDVPTVGLILMIVGLLSFLTGLLQTFLRRDQAGQQRPSVPQQPAPPYAPPHAPPAPPGPSRPPSIPPQA